MKKIYLWLERGETYKSIIEKTSVKIYDKDDILILKRINLNELTVNMIIGNIEKYGLKKVVRKDLIGRWL